MIFITVDDEQFALNDITDAVKQAQPDAQINAFNSSTSALDFASSKKVDIAFLDIEMGGMNGLELAKRLKDINSKTNIVFVTGYSDYAVDSYSVPACGYILKPVSVGAVLKSMENLRNPIKKLDKKIQVRCFGNFEVYVNDQVVHFSRSKAKEIFAYLIHKKGGGCAIRELTSMLFEEKTDIDLLNRNIQTYLSSMMKTLRKVNAQNVVNKKFNNISINMDKIDCDYYRFLEGDAEAVNSYTGEYMSNYSWAEFTIGYLDRMVIK